MLWNGLLGHIIYTCPNLWLRSCSKCYGMDCFGTYFTHVQTCDYVRVQSATEWTASVHTLHMSRPVITFLFKVLRNGLLRYILYTCPDLWLRSCSKCYGMDCFGSCLFKVLRTFECVHVLYLWSHIPKSLGPQSKQVPLRIRSWQWRFTHADHSDLFSLCGTQAAKTWQKTNQRVKFQRRCRNKQIQSKKGPTGGYMFFCKLACRWPKNTRKSKPPAGWSNLQNQYPQFMWKNTESLGMPRIENEHTPSLPSLSQMTKKCVSALHKSRLLVHAT